MQISSRFLIAALLATDVMAAAQQGSAKTIDVAPYRVSSHPIFDTMPPDYESWYVIAVIEVDNPVIIGNAPITDFRLVYKGGEIKASRVVLIEAIIPRPEFDARAIAAGDISYWVSSTAVYSWDGHLPAGKTRLRIRAAFPHKEDIPEKLNQIDEYRMKIGPYTVADKMTMRFRSY